MVLPGSDHDRVLALIPEARREILKSLKREGPLPVEAVAEALEITVSGARQHLSGLERDGVVTHTRVREGPGRPRHLYRLTDMGDALFPRFYGDLATELLGYVQERNPGLLDWIFERRTERRIQEARERMEGLETLEDRVYALAEMLEDEGYMPRVERTAPGTWLVSQRNCLVEAVARGYRGSCAAEMAFIRGALPATSVMRTAHAVDGKPCCAYRIGPEGSEQDMGAGVER